MSANFGGPQEQLATLMVAEPLAGAIAGFSAAAILLGSSRRRPPAPRA
jgi:hypothetical protein